MTELPGVPRREQAVVPAGEVVEHLFRRQAGQVLARLTRIFGLAQLDLVEDVVQDALVQALRRWPYQGIPDNPGAWILRVARNRALDHLRRDARWTGKQAALEDMVVCSEDASTTGAACFADELDDDALSLIFACCHPALPRESQVALTLRTVCAFSTTEIARAFLASETTIAQRIVRAKRRLRGGDITLGIPAPGTVNERLDAVLEVVYLLFNEGYSAHQGEALVRFDLCEEAIRLGSLIARHPLVGTPKANALASLMLLQGARLPARVDAQGLLLRLADQDRARWDRRLLSLGIVFLDRARSGDALTSYHLQAEIAACHVLASDYAATNWERVLHCYDVLLRIDPSPVVALNRLVALSQVHGAERALEELITLASEPALQAYYPLHATRAELLARLGRSAEAAAAYRDAIALVRSAPVRQFLECRASACELGQ